jgi:methylenetetrahydrofolate--tRNA-(uracil-5-)-methyltransferase
VPAGGALAVDRDKFSEQLTRWLEEDPNIELVAGEITEIPEERPLIISTVQLTGDALAEKIKDKVLFSLRMWLYPRCLKLV